ncbi:uncharacterized protein LOC113332110 [Papaver somniferum]|uniref:uncharacterized protein LOC113332110 n=1 Tax=Papaver somniferum TaxID=3469 RepID=UPI000E6F687B|nr:uncharacterized protein LOC113332110 [Papaver somniferum]
MAIKLDLSKAFDRLEWTFIVSVFKCLGFSEDWCQMIYQCISIVSYSVLVNGSPGEWFFLSRDIRQGDCLSPYIFIICMEVLSQLIIKAEHDNLIQGFKFSNDRPTISHLFFADDCMLFSKASLTYARNLMKIIDVFAKASGKAINYDKSSFITSSKTHHKHIKLLAKTLKSKFLSNSEKYLGTPLFINRNKSKSFQFVIENFNSRLSSCKRTNLNIAGTNVVTKHVLSSLVVYQMSCFPLPKKITSKIDSIQRRFWWSKKDPRHAAYFRSWGDIGKSKNCGGLGIRNTYATNRVLISKLGWRLLQNLEHLVSIFLKDKYFPNQNLLEIDKAADSSSWIWKGIVESLVFIKANIVRKINDGASTNIWLDNWIPYATSPPVSNNINYKDYGYGYVKNLIDVNNNIWNLNLLNSLFSPEDVIRIRAIKINLHQSDKVMWAHTHNGMFTIKSAYKAYMNESCTREEASFWRKVWSLGCLPKIKFFMWKTFSHMLPVNSLLSVYNPSIDDICPLCKNEVKTELHLLVQCPIVSHVWFGMSFQHLISPDLQGIDDYFLIKIAIDLNKVILDAKRMINSYIKPSIPVRDSNIHKKICRTEVEHFMFIDGSYKDSNMGVGIFWCDLAGTIKGSRADFGLIPDAVGDESNALFLGISWALEMNLSRVIFLSDCLQMVDFVNEDCSKVGWWSSDVLKDCRSLFSSNSSFKLMYINRVKKNLADKLDRRARKYCIKNNWVSFPPFLDSLVRKEPLVDVCTSLLS